jgi:hypothetical protein
MIRRINSIMKYEGIDDEDLLSFLDFKFMEIKYVKEGVKG